MEKNKNKHAYLLWLPIPMFKKLKETAQSEYKSIPRLIMDMLIEHNKGAV